MGERHKGVSGGGIQQIGVGSTVTESAGGAGGLVALIVHLQGESTQGPAPADAKAAHEVRLDRVRLGTAKHDLIADRIVGIVGVDVGVDELFRTGR